MTSQLPQTAFLPIEIGYVSAAGESSPTGAPATPLESAVRAEIGGSPFAQLLSPRLEAPGPVSLPAGSSVTGKSLPRNGSDLPFNQDAGPGAPAADFLPSYTMIRVPMQDAAAPPVTAVSAQAAQAPATPEPALLPPAVSARDRSPVEGRGAQANEFLARQPIANMPSELPASASMASGSPAAAGVEGVSATREIAVASSRTGREASVTTAPSRPDSAVRPDGSSQGLSPEAPSGLPQRLPGLAGDLRQNSVHDGRATPVLKQPEAAASPMSRGDGSGRPSVVLAPIPSTPTASDETSTPPPLVPGGYNARDFERLAGGAIGPDRAAADAEVSGRTEATTRFAALAGAAETPVDADRRLAKRFDDMMSAGQRMATMASPGEEVTVGADDARSRVTRAEFAEARLMSEMRVDRVHSVAPSLASPVQGPSTGVMTQGVTPAPTSIDTPVADPAWGEALSKRVSMLLSRNVGSAELRLSPAELGPLQVQIAVDDNVARVTFSAAHAVTREALEQALPRLREMLADQGISLADAGVSDQRGETGDDGADSAPADFLAADVETNPDSSGQPSPRSVEPLSAGRLDTYA